VWLSLAEAAKRLGVHPATVRAWADRGVLPSQRTPGGHRRFKPADLEAWQAGRSAGSVEAQLLVQSAMGRFRLEIGERGLADAPWYQALDPVARDAMSAYGRQLMDILVQYLATGDDALLKQAEVIGTRYAETIRAQNLKLSQAVQGFFIFHDLLLNAVIQWIEAGRMGGDQGGALRKVNTFTHTIIIALVAAYES